MIIPAKHREDYKTFFNNGRMGFGREFLRSFAFAPMHAPAFLFGMRRLAASPPDSICPVLVARSKQLEHFFGQLGNSPVKLQTTFGWFHYSWPGTAKCPVDGR
jgi:hypothetical protein